MTIDKVLTQPDLDDVLGQLKQDIFRNFNSVQIGKIDVFDPLTQTASIDLMITRIVDEKSVKYPLLLDCPVIFLGGKAGTVGTESYITIPVEPEDECIVFFNDRNIDNWFESGIQNAPADKRTHDLSDGIALVGLRSLKNNIKDFDILNMVLKHLLTTVKLGSTYEVKNGSVGAESIIKIAAGLFTMKNPTDSLHGILFDLLGVLIGSGIFLPATVASLTAIQVRVGLLLSPV